MAVKAEENKPFWKSKTKMGALLVGLSSVLATGGAILTGDISTMSGIQSLIVEIGVVLGIFGIRDWNIINGIKR